MTSPRPAPDPRRCPLCGGPNDCLLAAGGEGECWCRSEVFPRPLLDEVSAEAKRKACLCRECLKRAARAP